MPAACPTIPAPPVDWCPAWLGTSLTAPVELQSDGLARGHDLAAVQPAVPQRQHQVRLGAQAAVLQKGRGGESCDSGRLSISDCGPPGNSKLLLRAALSDASASEELGEEALPALLTSAAHLGRAA